jgi:hypothetical protein
MSTRDTQPGTPGTPLRRSSGQTVPVLDHIGPEPKSLTKKIIRSVLQFGRDTMVQRLRADSCLDRSVPLAIDIPARPERGPNAGRYFADKWNRLGTLGQYESLNPWIERLRKEGRR